MLRRNLISRSPLFTVATVILSVNLLCGFSIFHKKKYETPITKETMQPDKVLFDRAIKNIEKGQYLAARLTLNTLINTYDTSEYIAKAKLAIADSWFREGDAHGLAQAEIDYKDFILFYPNMEEAAESQFKICKIHSQQMLKPDRDNSEGQRAEDECRVALVQFPNSKFAKDAEQMLRNTQEVLAEKEMRTGQFYYNKGSLPAAQGRFSFVSKQYPLYSAADQALWEEADAFRKMGDRFETQEADSLTRIVRDYPASTHLQAAKDRLTQMKRPIPQSDPAAYARMKYNIENQKRAGIFAKTMDLLSGKPDVGMAAKQGAPAMAAVRPGPPVSVPMEAPSADVPTATGGTGISDVGIGVVSNPSAQNQANDVRLSTQADGEHKASVGSSGLPTDPAANPAPQVPLPTNHPLTKQEIDAMRKQQEAAAKAQKKAAAAAAKKGPKTSATPAPPTATTTSQPTTPAASQK